MHLSMMLTGTSEPYLSPLSHQNRITGSCSVPPVLLHLYQIVKCAHHHDTSGSLVNLKINIYIITALYPFCLRADIFFQHTDKFFFAIIFIIDCLYFLIRRKAAICFFTSVAYSVARIPRFIGTRCGVKLTTISLPAA